MHVAAGAVAKALLASIGIAVAGSAVDEAGLQARIDEARADRDTVGGVVEVRAAGVPPGLGSYATKDDRLDARIASAVMGIQAALPHPLMRSGRGRDTLVLRCPR